MFSVFEFYKIPYFLPKGPTSSETTKKSKENQPTGKEKMDKAVPRMAGSLRMGLSVKGGRTSQMWAHFCPRGVPRTEGPGAITREGLFPAPLPTSTECGPDMSQTRRASPPHRTRPSHRRLSPARPVDVLQAAVPACRSRLLRAPLPGTLCAPRPEDCAGSRPVS